MRPLFSRTTLALGIALSCGSLAGCHNEDRSPAAQEAKEALGVEKDREKQKGVEEAHDVTVVKETTVIDNATGKTLTDKKEVTPVTVVREKKVEKDVKVDVGKTQESETTK